MYISTPHRYIRKYYRRLQSELGESKRVRTVKEYPNVFWMNDL